MILKKIIFFFTISFTYCFSQAGSSSPFSAAGLGDINFRGTQVTRFMGGLDVFSDSIHANLNNPKNRTGTISDEKYDLYKLFVLIGSR